MYPHQKYSYLVILGDELAAVVGIGEGKQLYVLEGLGGREVLQEAVTKCLQVTQVAEALSGESWEEVVSQIPAIADNTYISPPFNKYFSKLTHLLYISVSLKNSLCSFNKGYI